MKKLLTFLLLFSFTFVQIAPIAPAYAGLGSKAVKAFKSFKAPKIRTYKAPRVITKAPSISVYKPPVFKHAPYKFKKSIDTAKVNIGKNTFTGKQGASLNRIKTSFSAKQSKFTPTYKQPPVTAKLKVDNYFGKQSIKFPKKLYPAKFPARDAAKAQFKKETVGYNLKIIRKGRDGKGRVVGVVGLGAGKGNVTYRPKLDGSYSVGKTGQVNHYRSALNGGYTVNKW